MSKPLTFRNVTYALRSMNDKNKRFLSALAKTWQKGADVILKKTISENFSGRPGLIRRSGKASQAIKTRTTRNAYNVVTQFFIDKNNPAKIYIPTHDKARRRRTISATNSKYLTFQMPDGKWVKKKRVFIPQRTDVFGTLNREGLKLRRQGIATAVRMFR